MPLPPAEGFPEVAADVAGRKLSGFPGLITLSALMFDTHDQEEILRLVERGARELVAGSVEGCFLGKDGQLSSTTPTPPPASGTRGGRPVRGEQAQRDEGPTDRRPAQDSALAALVARLGPDGGALEADTGWRWGFPLRSMGSLLGYLVLGSETEPSGERRFLMEALCQQTAAAVAGAALHRGDREHLARLRHLNDELSTTVRRLEQRTSVHEVLTRVSASGEGEAGIARAVHTLTGLPVAIEDPFGNLRHWAGLSGPGEYPEPLHGARRRDFLNRLSARGGPLHEHGRIISPVRPRSEVLGVLVLLDPEHRAGGYETFVAEYATMVLALELAHQHNLAEVELRVHRDLVDDLIAGTDDRSAFARATAIGHDLRPPHRVVAVRWRNPGQDDAVPAAAKRILGSWQHHALVSRQGGVVILVVDGAVDGVALYQALAAHLKTTAGAIGVGGRCDHPADLPRSHAEAMQALGVREQSGSPHGASTFDDLGIYRLLGAQENRSDVEGFMREWLGPLLDYDRRRHSELVRTLFEYLECGGNYDNAATALVIHRSTLRYRLARIREIADLDLTDVDTRLNLQVATRAWQLLRGQGPAVGTAGLTGRR